MEEELDISKLKYVLYARKSTTDETRQVRSIQDQIDDCTAFASRNGLHIVGKPQIETKSAKIPGKRPVFDKMLKDIKSGKYDGILSWNPDRLARNMLEGGLIIHLVDEEIIKDLKFVTHYFTKDANGKMLLGMAFVLSKQYSDDLSQKVTRGVRKSLVAGISPVPKHGYFRDVEKRYRPDGKNYDLIREAWELRRKHQSLESIAKYMNDKGYGRKVKKTGKLIRMDKKILTDLFKDPFYYGVLSQGGELVDLTEIYDFKPATTKEIFDEIQLFSRTGKALYRPRKETFYPFRALVTCTYCGRHMVSGPSSGNTKRYLYLRCDNPNCKRKKKSIRSKILIDFLYDFFRNKFKLTKDDYDRYYDRITQINNKNRGKITTEINSYDGILRVVNRDIRDRSLALVNMRKVEKEENEKEIDRLVVERDEVLAKIAELRQILTDPEEDKLSLSKFLNLFKNAVQIIKSADDFKKDAICRIVFLNLIADEENIASYQLKEPFATMLKSRLVTSGRGEKN